MTPSETPCFSEKAAEYQGIKILIVEDEEFLRLNYRAMLEDLGHHVKEAADGSEGLEVFKRELPDLVLTDLRMPVMDGLSLVRKIQKIAPGTPIIVVSGTGAINEAVESLRIGAWDFLAKPVMDGDMEIMIDQTLEKARLKKEKRDYRENLEEIVKQRTQKLSDLDRKWNQTFDALPDLIAIMDRDFKITRVNRVMAERLGMSAEACRGKTCFEVVHGTTGPPAFCPHLKTLKDGCVHTEEVAEESLGGVFSVSTSPIFDPEGRLIGSVHVARDVTEHKKLEAQFHQAQKMEAVGHLTGGVAHDFNNLINIIMGRAGLALSVMEPKHPACRDLREIIAAAERSADLTKQLLAFSRKQPIASKVLDLNKTIGDLLKMLKRLTGEKILLPWSPAVGLWPVKMDSSQFDQIMTNLCVNARDAIADAGSIAIETTNMSVDDTYCASRPGFRPGDYVLLTVTDDGCGMDEEVLGKIFEPFYTTKEEGKGTGLGLATVYGIVKQNSGYIDVVSEKGAGTIFKIFLPRHLDSN